MAVETAKIIVEGNTDGATVALKEAARATDQVTTASKAAGAQLADLTKQTQATSKAQAEATAAISRMRVAQDDAAMTARAFGAESKEAAEAQARLTRAVETAKKAEAAAKVELEGLKGGLAATSAAADKASPALARATAETNKLSAAAERNANELKKAELSQLANARASSKAAGGFDLAGFAGGKLSAVLGPAALGATLVATAGWLSEAATKTLQFETSLANLPFALRNAQDATHGLISESSLAVSASQALALGVVQTEAQFNQLASDAAKIALKLGTSSDQMLGDLTTALGRGSAMILDNAGIILKVSDANEAYAASIGKAVSELSEIEKKQAFQIAAMKAIRESADATTVAFDSNAAAVARTSVQFGNMWDSFSRGASNAAGAFLKWNQENTNQQIIAEQGMDAFKWIPEYAANAEAAAEITKRWNDEAEDGPITMTQWALATWRLSDASKSLQTVFESDAWRKASEDSKARGEALSQEAVFAERQAKAYAKMAAEQEAHLDAQAMASITMGPAPPPKSKAKGRGGKKAEAAVSSGDMAIARIGEGRDDTNAIALEAGIIERSNAAAAEAAAIAENIETRQRSIDAINQEIEAREAAGLAADDLIARRTEAERSLMNFERRNAKDRATLDQLETREQKKQHAARLVSLRASVAAEKAEQEKRAATMQVVRGHVEGFSTALVDGMQAEADGAEHAVGRSLQAWFKGIRNQMAIKALVEFAMGVGAAATFNPAAAAHFTAAGLATAAATAAGVAAAAVGAAIPGDSTPAGGGGGKAGAGAVGGSSGGGGGGSSREGNSAQDVPVSWTETRRGAVDMPRNTPTASNNTTHVTHVHVTGLVAGDENKLGAELNRLSEKGRRLGRRN